MQTTNATWRSLWASSTAWLETVATIGGTDYTEISNPVINRAVMQNGLSIGNAVSATCQFTVRTNTAIAKGATVQIKVRLTNGTTTSSWLPVGTFYIYHRSVDPVTGLLTLECYDALLKANALADEWDSYPSDMASFAYYMASEIGVDLDSDTTLKTGSIYTIEEYSEGTTIHDLLCIIAAANGGNWIISPENTLKLVPVKSAANASTATTDVVDVDAVIGAIDVKTTGTITGIRYTTDNEPVILGNATGLVLDVGVGAAIASALYDDMVGMTYQAYALSGAIYDPATELGDYIRAGANGEINSVVVSETLTLGLAFRSNVAAPEGGDLGDEYPYIGATEKALIASKVYAAKLVDGLNSSLDQQEVFNRITGNGTAQGLYMVNGQLYINLTYARAGTLILGGLNNQNGVLKIQDASGNTIGTWDKDGISVTKGSINGPSVTLGGQGNGSGILTIKDASNNNAVVGNADGLAIYSGKIDITKTYGTSTANVQVASIANSLIYCEYVQTNPNQSFYGTYVMSYDVGSISMRDYDYNKYQTSYSISGISIWIKQSSGGPTISLQNTQDSASVSISPTYTSFVKNSSTVFVLNENGTTADMSYTGVARVYGSFYVYNGTKSRVVETNQYSDRALYCYETPSPMFGDVGEGVIGDDGLCYVALDAVFAQTISTTQYQVFLQKYGAGDCWIADRNGAYFIVQGTPGLAFGWELKAKQKGYDQKRLDNVNQYYEPETTDYGVEAALYIQKLRDGRIAQ